MKVNEIWKDDNTGAKCKIIQVEKDLEGKIINIKIQSIRNASLIWDVSYWELKNNYTLIDSLHNARLRG